MNFFVCSDQKQVFGGRNEQLLRLQHLLSDRVASTFDEESQRGFWYERAPPNIEISPNDAVGKIECSRWQCELIFRTIVGKNTDPILEQPVMLLEQQVLKRRCPGLWETDVNDCPHVRSQRAVKDYSSDPFRSTSRRILHFAWMI
jgi:hypothetical protein